MVWSIEKLMMASIDDATTADSHSRTSSACLRSVMSMNDTTTPAMLVLDGAVGQQPGQEPAAVGQPDLALDRHQVLQHALRVVAQLRVVEPASTGRPAAGRCRWRSG